MAHHGNINDYIGTKEKGTTPKKQGAAERKIDVNLDSWSVDAACSGNPGVMEYQCVDTGSGIQIFHGGPYPDATNNIGEFLVLVHDLAQLKKEGKNIPIYSDSETAMAWVRNKKVNTNLKEPPP